MLGSEGWIARCRRHFRIRTLNNSRVFKKGKKVVGSTQSTQFTNDYRLVLYFVSLAHACLVVGQWAGNLGLTPPQYALLHPTPHICRAYSRSSGHHDLLEPTDLRAV